MRAAAPTLGRERDGASAAAGWPAGGKSRGADGQPVTVDGDEEEVVQVPPAPHVRSHSHHHAGGDRAAGGGDTLDARIALAQLLEYKRQVAINAFREAVGE